MKHVVIVGSGVAGVSAAASLRQNRFEGQIVVIGEEAVLPYQRPPLSKTWLLSCDTPTPTPIRPSIYFEENRIALVKGHKAVQINRASRLVAASDGSIYSYDALILATGAHPRRVHLPGCDLDNICYLRSLSEAAKLRGALHAPECKAVAIVGGGVIGLEVASAAIAQGKNVTVIEAAARPMTRVASPAVTNYIRRKLEADGVVLRFGVQAEEFLGRDGRVCGVRLSDGTVVPAQLAVIAIGATPSTQLAENAGLDCNDGILVDCTMRTSDPSIFAIGDCAKGPSPIAGAPMRLETIHNAVSQAQIVAATISGRPLPTPAPPRFWSDLRGMKVQSLGIARHYDLVREKADEGKDTCEIRIYAGKRLIATETINLPHRQLELANEIARTPVLADP